MGETEEKKKENLEEMFDRLDPVMRKLWKTENVSSGRGFWVYRSGNGTDPKDANRRLDTVEKKMLQMNEDGTFREF